MKRIILTTLAGATLVFAVNANPPYKLVEAWATEPILDTPECALFNRADQRLYVSNVSGPPFEKNGKGFISKVNLKGEILEIKWATGLNAPKGMALHGNHLYVSDIDALMQLDLSTGSITARYPAEGAGSLNDVAVDADGTVYVSDSRGEQIMLYRLRADKLEPWIKAPALAPVNGLHMLDDRLLAGRWADHGTLYSIDLATGQVSEPAQIEPRIDGLKPDGKGNYFTSDWMGRITLITAEGDGIVLQDTTDQKINAADFEYLPDRKLLIVPTFYDNRLLAYHVEKPIPVYVPEKKVGSPAPDFKAVDQDGKPWSLQDHLGGKHIVVYFYPAAMTGGCTKQACSYRDYITKSEDPSFLVVGISGDTPEGLKHFQQTEVLNFTLLSDPGGSIAKTFGVPVKEGTKTIKRTIGDMKVELTRSATTARWTFIIDPSGKIIYRDTKVKAVQDLEQVLGFLQSDSK
jgi:peroxiredoxin